MLDQGGWLDEATVVRSDFGWEVDDERGVQRSQVEPVGPLVFERGPYEQVLREALERFAAVERAGR